MFHELLPFALFFIPFLLLILKLSGNPKTGNGNGNGNFPKSYPLIGSLPSIYKNRNNRLGWYSDLLRNSPSATFTMQMPLGHRVVVTANPAVVHHMLKSNFPNYQKGPSARQILTDLLGDGIFNADGETWKFQRQLASHEFNTKSLRKFVEEVVDTELNERLIHILSESSKSRTVLDLQDILQRFAFDNICKIGFGYDPEYLLPSLPKAEFAAAFDEAVRITGERLGFMRPVWKIRRFLGLGAETRLDLAVADVRGFANGLIRQKKLEMEEKKTLDSHHDLLSRFLSSGNSDEKFVTDIVISFILAGRDTTSAALTWFFWLVSSHQNVEEEILKEIEEMSEKKDRNFKAYDEAKEMVYVHAALCESMRLYPPVPIDHKEAMNDDVLPEGTRVRKGTAVAYNVYAMGRMENIWGEDWPEFKPERWLERDVAADRWRFVGKDVYSYPVFQAGPRVCLGKEMAFLQMKRVVVGVLKRFRIFPEKREEVPEYVTHLTAKMRGGFPVTVVERFY